ncbi:hypothetical protein WJR50_18945 [Catalinimonas sp. 4WD22]|uniref:hypothetical protein n=1 Tax=Catalinimonas locisalis TaxID=3133978 RepID=UPI003100B381
MHPILLEIIRNRESSTVQLPSAPAGMTLQGGQGKIVISWSGIPAGVTNRVIEASLDASNYSVIASVQNGDFTLNDTAFEYVGLADNTTVYIRMQDQNEHGFGPYNTPDFAVTNEPVDPPGEPLGGFSDTQLIDAYISNNESDVLVLQFDDTVNLGNWVNNDLYSIDLKGGCCRVKNYINGSGTNTLRFRLSDHALPDDEFEFFYRHEVGSLTSNGGKVNTQNFTVDNQTTSYQGTGTIYYISETGNDANNGLSPGTAKRNYSAVQNLLQAGDYALFRRGDSWTGTRILFNRSGNANQYITIGSYGTGAKPVISGIGGQSVVEFTRSYNAVADLEIIHSGGKGAVHYVGSERCITSNCTITRNGGIGGLGILFAERESGTIYPIVLHNTALRFSNCIRSSGADGTNRGTRTDDGTPTGEFLHQVQGGRIHGNLVGDNPGTNLDGIGVMRGDYNGIVVQYNTVRNWGDDGFDHFAGRNIINQYNTAINPNNGSVNAFKIGGSTGNFDADNGGVRGAQAKNVICRYNKALGHSNANDGYNVINLNDGRSAEIYGNLIVGCTQGTGIKLGQSGVDYIHVYNNTIIECRRGMESWGLDGNTNQVQIYNNIFHSNGNPDGYDMSCSLGNGNGDHVGRNNIFCNGSGGGAGYTGQGDINNVSLTDLFVDPQANGSGDYTLKAGSVAINAGFNIAGYTKDINSFTVDQIDIGCHEYRSGELVSTTIHLCGDSTVNLNSGGKHGWGEYFGNYVNASATVNNRGDSGESADSFYELFWSGGANPVRDQVSAGHYVLFQFGHNDQYSETKGTSTAVMANRLRSFVDETRARGGNPILVTPVERMIAPSFNSHGNYDDTVRSVATEKNVVLLDLQALSQETFLYLYSQDGTTTIASDFASSDSPPSGPDETHFSASGADRVARMVLSLINASGSNVKQYMSNQNFTWNKTNYA